MENPPNDALRRLAELYQHGRMQELLNAGQPLMLQFPNSAPLLTLIGAANLSTGKFSQARAARTDLVTRKNASRPVSRVLYPFG